MILQNKIATVFGGTGFIGKQVVRELAAKGITIKVATRAPESAYFLRPCGSVGQIVPFQCNYNDPDSIENAVKGSDYVINCIGILYQRRKNKFDYAHRAIPENIAKACEKHDVERFVHISALGIDGSKSKYAQSKVFGEKAVHEHFSNATILKPSIVFGPEDALFNKFAKLSRYMPFLPLIGGGKTKFQPVYVGDVADAALACILQTGLDGCPPCGNSYELGGPDVITFKELYNIIFKYTCRTRPLLPIPYWLAKFQALFLSILPNPLLTPDQVESLKTDSIVRDDAKTLANLGVNDPRSMEAVLPGYLEHYCAGGHTLKQTTEG